MKGSMIASMIESDLRREQYWKTKVVRQKCYIDKEKQCTICKYQKICEDSEVEQNTIK